MNRVLLAWSVMALLVLNPGAAVADDAGKKKFESFNPLPDKSTEALKENLEWKTKPR